MFMALMYVFMPVMTLLSFFIGVRLTEQKYQRRVLMLEAECEELKYILGAVRPDRGVPDAIYMIAEAP